MKMDAVTVTPPIDSFTFCLSSDSLSVEFLYHHNTIADVKAARDVNENNRNGGARRSEQPQSRRRTTRRRRRTTTTPGSRQGAEPVKAFFSIVQPHVKSESCLTCFSFLVQKLPLNTGHIGLLM